VAQPIHFNAIVSEVIVHCEDVHTYTLISDKQLPKILSGQFIHLSLDIFNPANFWPESRVFSVANAVFDRKTIKLVIGKQGEYTKRILNELHVGSVVSCKGPYGDFIIRTESLAERVIVLIAGGTGITPFSAFMETLLQQEQTGFLKCMLFYGARSTDLLIYKKLADACAAKFNNFETYYYAEKYFPEDKKPLDIKNGRLNIDLITDALKHDKQVIYYLSGPKMMIDYFSCELKGRFQHPVENILIDAW
jgi:ferredoxin-NADP reductase